MQGDRDAQVLPGARMTQHIGDLAELARQPPNLSSGWCSATPAGATASSVDEILRNDWLTAPADLELVFSGEPRDVWAAAMQSIGLDPNSLPLWTNVNGEGPVN